MKRIVFALLAVMLMTVSLAFGFGGPSSADSNPVQGYWIIEADGHIEAFGGAQHHGEPSSGPIVAIEPTPSGNGYWTLNAAGVIESFGDAPAVQSVSFSGDDVATNLLSTDTGGGLWVVSRKGCVQPYGDAESYGDMCNQPLNADMIGAARTLTGNGYWLLGRDGGVFSFGDASFHGSTGGLILNAPVNGIAVSPTGYWLVADDGGIFAFDSDFWGSMGGGPINEPVVGMVGSPTGGGYLMVARDGGIFNFRDISFYGSGVDRNMSDVIGVAAYTPSEVVPPVTPLPPVVRPPEVFGLPWTEVFGTTTSADNVVIPAGTEVHIDADVEVGSVSVEAGAGLYGHPTESFTFNVARRMDVAGHLESKPQCGVTHTFHNTYTGTWLHRDEPNRMNEPGFYFNGSTYSVDFERDCVRDPWGEVYGGLTAGDTSFTMSEVDGSWYVGDSVVVYDSSELRLDDRGRVRNATNGATQVVTITDVNGPNVTFEPALTHDHPDPYGHGVEVHNLNQSVTFSGTLVYEPDIRQLNNGRWRVDPDPGGDRVTFDTREEAEQFAWDNDYLRLNDDVGRSHVMVMGPEISGPQPLGVEANPQTWTGIRFSAMGALEPSETGAHDGPALGRYPLHFHRMGDIARGTVIDRVTVDDSRNHAIVIHASHGVTVSNTAAYKISEDAYWWDTDTGGRSCEFAQACDSGTMGITYDTVLAGHVRSQNPGQRIRLSGFQLGSGAGDVSQPQRPQDVNVIRNSVVVDLVGGHPQSNGMEWPEDSNSGTQWNTWVTENNEVHNAPSAFFVWQNTSRPHVEIRNNVAWHSRVGWFHGAYSNHYEVTNFTAQGVNVCVDLHAAAGASEFNGGTCLNPLSTAFLDSNHRLPAGATLRLADGTLVSGGNAFRMSGSNPAVEFVDWKEVRLDNWTVSGAELLWIFDSGRNTAVYAQNNLVTNTLDTVTTDAHIANAGGACYWPPIGDDPRPTDWCPNARPTNAEIVELYGDRNRFNDNWLVDPLDFDVPTRSVVYLEDRGTTLGG